VIVKAGMRVSKSKANYEGGRVETAGIPSITQSGKPMVQDGTMVVHQRLWCHNNKSQEWEEPGFVVTPGNGCWKR